jgi:hypothetical protein
VYQDAAVSELQHDADVSPGLIVERCPGLGTSDTDHCEDKGGRDGEHLK